MAEKVNRWKFVYAALVMQLCLGVLYSWSVFRGPLEVSNGWDKATSIAPYRYSVLFFTVSMIIARITSYNVCYTKLLRRKVFSRSAGEAMPRTSRWRMPGNTSPSRWPAAGPRGSAWSRGR